MAIKISCNECGKRISIDEAFAGGVCRCPYCAALVQVAGDTPIIAGLPRPDAPSVSSTEPEASAAAVIDEAHVPTASPVKSQGVAAIVMGALALILVVGGIVAFLQMRGSDKPVATQPAATADDGGKTASPKPDDVVKTPPIVQPLPVDPPPTNPFKPSDDGKATVAGLPVEFPVLICIDSGSSMRSFQDYAIAMARVSVRGMKPADKFNIMFFVEGDDDDASWYELLAKDYQSGGPTGEELIKKAEVEAVGMTNVSKGLTAALALKPRTIVFFARKPIDEAVPVGAEARGQGVKIITVALEADPGVREGMSKLAKASGGRAVAYSAGQLQRWAPPLD